MFVKAICFKDVRPGDVVCKMGEFHNVSEVRGQGLEGKSHFTLFFKNEDGANWLGFAHQIIGLVYRPWPEVRDEDDMLQDIEHLAGLTSKMLDRKHPDAQLKISELHETIEAYELGKPFKSDQAQSSAVDAKS